MQERHKDRKLYFEELAYSSEKYTIPYLESFRPITDQTKVLEIGCGDGGNLYPFIKRGCNVFGFDLNAARIENALEILDVANNDKITIICEDVFKVDNIGLFDLIIVRDVIEHIPDKTHFFSHLRRFVKPDGIVFFAFPAWYMPFGGHQQIANSKLLAKLPFYHILPKSIYKTILKGFGEDKGTIDELLSVKECGITIERFRKYAKRNGYKIAKETFYFINPHYEVKFKLKPRLLSPVITKIPFVRNFFSTSCVCILQLK